MLRITAALALLGSTVASGAEPRTHRINGDLAIQTRDIFKQYCAECHTGSPDPGKSKLRLLDFKQVVANDRRVPLVARDRSLLLDLVKDGSMPPANRRAPTPDEVKVLEQWVAANTPAYPEVFDERFVLETIADDLDADDGKAADQSRRYVSFAHLLGDDQPRPKLADAERQVADALALVTGVKVKLEPVDPTATVFRLDLGQLGWQTGDIFDQFLAGAPGPVHRLRPFDLLLLEYPFAARPTGDVAKRLETFLDTKNQTRPVPYLRGDWLTAVLATGGKLTPLGEDLKSLAALGRGGEKPRGPPVPRAMGGAPFVSAKLPDGRAPIPPLSAWYAGDVTPFTLTADLVSDGRVVKGVAVDQSFKLRVSSDRRVFLTLLMIRADGAVLEQNLGGRNVLPPKVERELAPGADGFVITGIPTSGDKATEYFVLFASEIKLPDALPVIVQSRHSGQPVQRFLLEPAVDAPFDPNKVVRKVIPIPVTRNK